MKNYSEAFKHPESFIIDIIIDQEQKKLYVKFGNGGTLEYPLTREELERFMGILSKQYAEVSKDNQKVVKEKYNCRVPLVTSFLFGIGGIITSMLLKNPEIMNIASAWLIVTGTYGGINGIARNRSLDDIKTRMEFINKKIELIEAAEVDSNIVKNTSQPTMRVLAEQQSLKSKDLIGDEFNILFTDKAKLKDLKEWLLKYKMIQGLEKPIEVKRRIREK